MRHRIAALCILLAGPVFAGANAINELVAYPEADLPD
jgi:hypothetical protein